MNFIKERKKSPLQSFTPGGPPPVRKKIHYIFPRVQAISIGYTIYKESQTAYFSVIYYKHT